MHHVHVDVEDFSHLPVEKRIIPRDYRTSYNVYTNMADKIVKFNFCIGLNVLTINVLHHKSKIYTYAQMVTCVTDKMLLNIWMLTVNSSSLTSLTSCAFSSSDLT